MKQFLLYSLVIIFSLSAQAQQYVVQIAAFEQPVSADYFKGISVQQFKDHQNFYRYYTGNFSEKTEAQDLAKALKSKGYHAYVLDWQQLTSCSQSCSPNLQLGCDVPQFKLASAEDYEKIRMVLQSNPNYRIYLADNDRAQQAKCYLSMRGLSPCSTRPIYTKSAPCDRQSSDVYIIDSGGQAVDIDWAVKMAALPANNLAKRLEQLPESELVAAQSKN